MDTLPFQLFFRPELPTAYGPLEYRDFRAMLEHADQLLTDMGLDFDLALKMLAAHPNPPRSAGQRERLMCRFVHAVRCTIARHVMALPLREFAIRLADSTLLQWFCHCGPLDSIKPSSKSSLERYEKMVTVEAVREAVHRLINAVSAPETLPGALPEPFELDEIFADCTCVKARIHFPVDWVLLRDAARTLIKAIVLIRRQGLKHRMPAPETLARDMNRLCIQMSNARRRGDARRQRKRTLRFMKRLAKRIERHARRYRELLAREWARTSWSEAQAAQVLGRIDAILGQLPQAVHQAHERIIGERRVANAEKILSLYEDHVHVLVRGKAGAEVEFGNGLYLAEQADGLIVDWELFEDQPPSDTALVERSVTRITEAYGKPAAFTTDRGFDSQANRDYLHREEIFNGLCPRDPARHARRRNDPGFVERQVRRGQTEGRIGIFKNVFLDAPFRVKSFTHRRLAVAWCVLAHNLWLIARKVRDQENQSERPAQAA